MRLFPRCSCSRSRSGPYGGTGAADHAHAARGPVRGTRTARGRSALGEGIAEAPEDDEDEADEDGEDDEDEDGEDEDGEDDEDDEDEADEAEAPALGRLRGQGAGWYPYGV